MSLLNGVPHEVKQNDRKIKAILSHLKMISLLTPPYQTSNKF
jgi:hypothetical protein